MFLKSNLMIYNRSKFLWLLLLIFGLNSNQSDARAVNISNTWTLPHDGFTVFYRFFRDQISWFEADAVCQFHHANLVTVTNSVEFDASREFLRTLDVTEPVWIGLMRSQNSDRFFWSNSKPLGSTTEYWAESLPVIDAPLCAVIDPVRDYRWHALRCGGPETASFLCEMNVPSWAEECVIRDIPSLTIQYMADSGTVEMTKDCGDEYGIIQQICRGKQDLDKIINRLVCKNEKIQQEISQNFNHQRQNLFINSDILNSHKKSIEMIRNAETDNNEDNNISILNNKAFHPIQEKLTENPVQKLIEQFNVEELMQADQPQQQDSKSKEEKTLILSHKIIAATIDNKKPTKRLTKKLKLGEKKMNKKFSNGRQPKKQRGKNIAIEDIMMGDQPFIPLSEIDNMNEIQEPLPHSKKMFTQDLKHDNDSFAREKSLSKNVKEKQFTTVPSAISLQKVHPPISESTSSLTYTETVNDGTITMTTATSPISFTSEFSKDDIASISKSGINSSSNKTQPSVIKDESETVTAILDSSESTTTVTSSHGSFTTISSSDTKLTSAVTIGHPMHPQQPRGNVISEETIHQHIKESNDNHFIPPMLMVKSHYQSPKSIFGHNSEHHPDLQIIKQKTSPSDLNLNNDMNHNLTNESTEFPTTTQWDEFQDTENKHEKPESTNVSFSENMPAIHPDLQKIFTIRTTKSQSSSDEIRATEDNSKSKSELTPNGTIAPNELIEIKLSNFSIENPTTISSSPSLTVSLPITSKEKIKTKIMNSTNLSNIKVLSIYPSSFVVNKSSDAALKSDFSTILTKIAVEPSPVMTSFQETLKKDVNKISKNNTKTVPDEESLTLTTEKRNNLTIVFSFSEPDLKNQNNNINNKNNKNNDEEEQEYSYKVSNESTTIADKGLVPVKGAIIIETDSFKNLSKLLSSSFIVLTTTTSSPKRSLFSIEEEFEVHDDTKKSTTAPDTYTSDEENFQQHKPNRRRTLTKPETTSYLKKILG